MQSHLVAAVKRGVHSTGPRYGYSRTRGHAGLMQRQQMGHAGLTAGGQSTAHTPTPTPTGHRHAHVQPSAAAPGDDSIIIVLTAAH